MNDEIRYSKYSITSRAKYWNNRNQEVIRLRNSARELGDARTQEYLDTIVKSYEQSTDVDKLAIVSREKTIRLRGYRSIGLYRSIEREKYFASNYYWIPFFADVGRSISRGERRYIHSRMGRYVRGVSETISRTKPDFDVLDRCIVRLQEKDFEPNVMLAPIRMYTKFLKKYSSRMEGINLGTDQVNIQGCNLHVLWSHVYAPLQSFIIFNSSAGIWHVLEDIDTEKRITVAIGVSKEEERRMAFLVETMAYYEILNRNAFTRINLSR